MAVIMTRRPRMILHTSILKSFDKKITSALGTHDNCLWVLAYAANNVNG